MPRELQPLVKYKFALDGTPTENVINIGRGRESIVSTAKWEENRLIITSFYPYQDPKNGKWHKSKLIQTIWLEDAINAPWEPILIVETHREGVLGGISSINRTVYNRGYR